MTFFINGLVLLLTFALLVAYVRRTLVLLPVLVFVLYQNLWLLLSCVYVEQGVYLADTRRMSYFDGSTLRLLLFLIAFFCGLIIALRLAERYGWAKFDGGWDLEATSERLNKAFYYLAVFVCLALSAVLAANLLLSGTILTTSSITRFNFYTTYSAIGIAQYISYVQIPICLFAGMVIVYRKSMLSRIFALCLFLFQVTYLWLMGNEATAFMVNALFFMLSWLGKALASHKLNVRVLRRSAVICLVFIFGVLAVKYYSVVGGSIYSAESEDSFTYRLLALQSNTWWNVDGLVWKDADGDPGQRFTEMGQLFGNTDSTEAGIWYLMQRIVPEAEYVRYILENGTLNAGYPTINIAIFGYAGGVAETFFGGFVFMLASVYFYGEVRNGQFLCACMSSLVYMQFVRMYTMGGIGYLFNLLPMLCAVLLVCWETLSCTGHSANRWGRDDSVAWIRLWPIPSRRIEDVFSGWTRILCPSI